LPQDIERDAGTIAGLAFSARRASGCAAAGDRLTPLLRRPEAICSWQLTDWDWAVRQGRRAGLLARVHAVLAERRLLDAVPEAPRRHLAAAHILAEKHAADVRREVRYIQEALAGLDDVPVILLKGASYLLADLPPACGRLFSDIDILVPHASLAAVEGALAAKGWAAAKQDAYDQRYYREWMHEIPPLEHTVRRTVLDVHHTIVPPTAGLAVDVERLRARAVPIDESGRLAVLGPADMVLHSAVHLFNEGEFDNGLRDLDDLDRLLRHFAADRGFWDELLARAAEFRLERPLYFALRYAAALLGTPVPERCLGHPSLRPPGALGRLLMDTLFGRALRPAHASCADRLSGAARLLLYIRAHYLRMPLRLLVPHLVRKAVLRRLPAAEP
jgi:hypothetical protein